MRLGFYFKEPNIEKLKSEVSMDQFFMWKAYERIEPFDMPEAMIVASVINCLTEGAKADPLDYTKFGLMPKVMARPKSKMMQEVWNSGLATRTQGGKKVARS